MVCFIDKVTSKSHVPEEEKSSKKTYLLRLKMLTLKDP